MYITNDATIGNTINGKKSIILEEFSPHSKLIEIVNNTITAKIIDLGKSSFCIL